MQKEDSFSTTTWNLTDTNLIIPIENLTKDEASSEQLVGAVSENNLVGNNSMGHTLLIGLDKSFFESSGISKDVIFIQNGDLKVSGGDLKANDRNDGSKPFISSGSYLISLIESEKVDDWQNLNLRRVRKSQKQFEEKIPQIGPVPSSSSVFDEQEFTTHADSNSTLKEESVPIENRSLESDGKNIDKIAVPIGHEDGIPSCSSSVTKSLSKKPLLEKNLPLKKKAKMKGPDSFQLDNCNKSVPKTSSPTVKPEIAKDATRLLNRKKIVGKRKCCYSDSDQSGDEEGNNAILENCSSVLDFQSINDVVNDFLEKDLIDQSFADLILKGIIEMKVDVFEEMKKTCAKACSNYSNELLSFAYLLYFLKRPAYHYMGAIFGNAWPSSARLKEWKGLVNSEPKHKLKKVKKKKDC